MDITQIIDWVVANPLYAAGIALISIFIIIRAFRTARIYLGQKSYVKKARKLDRKKYNGLQLLDKIKKKRKRDSNAYNKLKGGAKKKVRKYFAHKAEELPVFVRYSYGKLLKRSKDKLIILIKNNRKTLKKVHMKKTTKQFIEVTNKYNCLDELVNFLHNLPEAIVDQQNYDIYVGEEDLLITYVIK